MASAPYTDEELAESRPTRILRALSRSPGALSTSQIVDELAEGIKPRQKVLAWYGNILRDQVQAGTVEAAGKVRSARYHGAPTRTWHITDEGRKRLAYIDDASHRKAERKRLDAEMAEAARVRAKVLSEAVLTCSRDTPRAERREIALRLRSLGCTLEDIGSLFGVSREMIRQDLLLPGPPGPRGRKPEQVRGPRFAEAVPLENMLMLRIGKRKLYLTRGEARQVAEVIRIWEDA